jgi:ubiquinone/menaquinone biosynthesis C-methylase UbiE
MRIFPTPRYRDVQELLDIPGQASEQDLVETLRDIRRANIFGLGTWVIKYHLARLVEDFPDNRTLRVLDIATGSADIPEELCRWAQKAGRKIEITATDISPEILQVARERIKRAGFEDAVYFVACDAIAAPFAEGAFDIVTCSLALHHLSLAAAHNAMREMERLSRLGFIINDIYRAQGAWIMAWILTRLTTTNRLTRHDGPASVYRAFTSAELRKIARNSGITARIHTHPFWRAAVVGKSKTHTRNTT